MPVTLDATPGGLTSNSYLTAAEADTYFATRGFCDAWNALTTPQKELQLMWATRLIDSYHKYIGQKYKWNQALSWPRWNAQDKEGFLIPWDIVPQQLKNATAEYAFQLIGQDWSQGQDSIIDEGVQIGTIKTTKERHNPLPHAVQVLLSGLVSNRSGGVQAIEMFRG